jgi:hypothetical protein
MSATQKGVENHRRELLTEIVKNRTEILAGELKEGGATPEDLAGLTPAAEPVNDDPKRPQDVPIEEWASMSDEDKASHIKAAEAPGETEEQKAAREAEERKQAEAAVPKTEKLKVDGQEVEVPVDKVLEAGRRALQKESAADKRLEEASRLFREAQDMIKNAAAGGGAAATTTSASPSKDGSPIADEALAKLAKTLQYGSEAEAASALKEVIQAAEARGQTLTQNDVIELLDYRDARQWAEGEYKEILGDPKLRTLFVAEEKRMRAAGDGRPYREVYEEIGNGLRDWRKTFAPPPVPPTGAGRDDVKAKKTAVISVPVAAARLPEKLQPKEPTQSEIIEGIRKARHQA